MRQPRPRLAALEEECTFPYFHTLNRTSCCTSCCRNIEEFKRNSPFWVQFSRRRAFSFQAEALDQADFCSSGDGTEFYPSLCKLLCIMLLSRWQVVESWCRRNFKSTTASRVDHYHLPGVRSAILVSFCGTSVDKLRGDGTNRLQ